MAHMRGGIRTTQRSRQTSENANTRVMEREKEWGNERADDHQGNVGEMERVFSGVIGGGLLLRSLLRPSGLMSGISALLGVALLHRATTGHCAVYGTMGINTLDATDTSSIGRRKVHTQGALKIEESIVVGRSAKDLFGFWRQLENLPQVMTQVRSVESIGDRRSHWVINTLPGAPTVEWDAEIINEVENERIGWRTLQGAVVEHAGSVQFHPVDEDRSTRVTVTLQYDPPADPIGAAIAALLGQDPRQKIAGDLERFKQTMESQASSPH